VKAPAGNTYPSGWRREPGGAIVADGAGENVFVIEGIDEAAVVGDQGVFERACREQGKAFVPGMVSPLARIIIVVPIGRQVIVIAITCDHIDIALDDGKVPDIAEVEFADDVLHRAFVDVVLAAVEVVLGGIGRHLYDAVAMGDVIAEVEVGMQAGIQGRA
jgi:hypothetical protein